MNSSSVRLAKCVCAGGAPEEISRGQVPAGRHAAPGLRGPLIPAPPGRRRRKARLGSPKAITAMAHKLARILWHLLKFKQPFNPEVFAQEEAKLKRRKLARLQNLAESLNCRLVPLP